MRRSREDTAKTRRQIVEVASRLFRARGLASVGVADVMSELGLTVGGFYRHFASKDALVAEAIEAASIETTSRTPTTEAGPSSAKRALVDAYLSRFHVEHPEMGCPVAALCSEIAHETRGSREAFSRALEALLETVRRIVPGDSKRAREQRLHAAAAAVGAVVLARATTDPTLADDLLRAVRRELTGSGARPGSQ
jgi:TetR/AcrR family transcriptional regulator, transcriptional repressor for nem operon